MGVRASLLQLYNPVAGNHQLTAGGAISTGSANITMAATIPSWVIAGMPVWDVTAVVLLGKVSSGAGTTTLVLAANSASNGSGSADVLQFGLTPSDIQVGTASGRDMRGIAEILQLRCSEMIQLLNDVTTDVLTSGQDATLNTLLAAQVTALS